MHQVAKSDHSLKTYKQQILRHCMVAIKQIQGRISKCFFAVATSRETLSKDIYTLIAVRTDAGMQFRGYLKGKQDKWQESQEVIMLLNGDEGVQWVTRSFIGLKFGRGKAPTGAFLPIIEILKA